MEIPIQCKRTKNINLPDDFIRAVEQSCNGKKAEKLPDDSFYKLYIGDNLLNRMTSTDNQLIWGRRGTGKTHLLKAFVQKINNDSSYNGMALYISCDSINTSSPVDMHFNSDIEKMKYLGQQAFRNFIISIIEQIIDSFHQTLDNKLFKANKYSSSEKQDIINAVDNSISNIISACSYGVPAKTTREETETITNDTKKEKTTNTEFGIEGTVKFPFSFLAKIKAILNKKNNKTTSVETSDKTIITTKYSFSTGKLRRAIDSFVNTLGIDTLFICIDELWLVDSKRELCIQPIFLDYIRQVLLCSNKVSIKIASIREVTKTNSKNSAKDNYGLQIGHDIQELVNLDTLFLDMKARIAHYKDILVARINYFAQKNSGNADEYMSDFVIKALFKEENNLKQMILLSHLIPRNFLNLLQRCVFQLNSDFQHYYIHSYLVREIVISIYLEGKRSNMPMNVGSLFDTINQYIQSTGHYFFIIESKETKRLKVELDNLIYCEIIHQVPSSILPENVMDRYKGFFIDSGKYLHSMTEKNKSIDDSIIYDFNYTLSNEIINNISDYIIDISAVESDFIECPNCSTKVSKKNPVYTKAKICPVCATDLKSL